MFILIDRAQSAIVHKHIDLEALRLLSWIECANDTITLPLGNPAHLSRELENHTLRDIYKASTGKEIGGFGNALAVAVHRMALRLPETNAALSELQAQRKHVMDGDKSHWQYARGAMVPLQHSGTFTPDPLKTEPEDVELQLAAQSRPVYTPNGVPSAPGGPAAGATAPNAREAREPQIGGKREIIFRVADDVWSAAGSPRELPAILQLRKRMMDILESEHGMKRTTSSTALGDWQKLRLS